MDDVTAVEALEGRRAADACGAGTPAPGRDAHVTFAGRYRFVQLVIGLIALHSCLLGLSLMFFPRLMMQVLGLDMRLPIFFPSQAGVFLLLLGLCYLNALRDRSYFKILLVSKTAAVTFLSVHIFFLAAPAIITLAFVIDLAMLAALVWLQLRYRPQLAAARCVPEAPGDTRAP